MATVSYHHLTEERDALAWDLFQQTNDPYFTYRDARDLATESLISAILYAVQWDATVNAQRLAAGDNQDAPVRNEYTAVEEPNRITIVVYRDGAHAGRYIFDDTPAGRAAMRRRIAVLERNHFERRDTDYDNLGNGDEPAIDETAEPDRGPQVPQRSARDKARDKAAYFLANGLRIARDRNGDALVPSGTRGGLIHRVHHGVCSCEAGQKNRACWHLEAVQMVEEPRRAA